MTLADEIRNSFVLPQSFFEKNIIPDLKGSGSASVICDHHIGEICNYAIPFKYGNSLEKWAYENGFSVNYKYNSYGVRHIVISI
jgi:hypothetical protein